MASGSRQSQTRRERRAEIIDVTRALLDEQGVQDVPIDQIAKNAGINKAQIYRYFESKDELLALTLDRYLEELDAELGRTASFADPVERLDEQIRTLVDYCVDHPAFLDCTFALMRQPAGELTAAMSEGAMFRLGRALGRCVDHLAQVLRDGVEAGVFVANDPETLANLICAQALGIMQLARVGAGVRMTGGGFPEIFPLDRAFIREACRNGVLASVGASRQRGGAAA
ncbi:MAG: TetR/AcrR family transcriptional regulator [Solirubrobacteraceae bacterium]|nr:TetR/AcrR family transcriptional regulator [Solirubrobacteraceae bacterium]